MAVAKRNFFSDEFIDKIPEDLIDGVLFICNYYFNNHSRIVKSPEYLSELYAAYNILSGFLEKHGQDSGKALEFSSKVDVIQSSVAQYLRNKLITFGNLKKERDAKEKFDDVSAKINSKFGNYKIYELSSKQLKGIQNLINELRDKMAECEYLDESHKQRLLKRLEKLQAELHIKMTNYDKIYGFAFEMNFLYSNIKETKPLFDLTIKIVNIALQATAAANGLPPAPLLFPVQ